MNDNLVNDLFNEELSDFFDSRSDTTDIAPSNEGRVNNETPKKKVDINKLIDIFGVNKKHFNLKSDNDIKEIMKAIKVVKENIASIASAYGDEIAQELLSLIPDEELLEKRLKAIMERRLEKIQKLHKNENLLKAEEEEFNQVIEKDPSLLSIAIYFTVGYMIEKRLENKKNESGSSSSSMKGIITSEDKEQYLKSLFKKIKLIEDHTGVKLDQDFINFFTSDEYIYSTTSKLPDILRDEDFTRIMSAWSLPILVNDNREELANKEIYSAEDSIKALERYVAINGLGSTEDNPTIVLLNKLRGDVAEEKNRVNSDIDFFKKEKLKERVEVAILYSVKDQTKDSKLQSLSNALKETITDRINYMKDETVLRQKRKEYTSDKSNKDNEKNSKDYLSALTGVNQAINKRREERASNIVKFVPKSIVEKRLIKDAEVVRDNVKDEAQIDSQSLSYGGRQKVLNYYRTYNNKAS
jgi:hypothetical protein